MEFNFDDQKQNIMDIHIPDQHCYYIVRDAIHYNVMEGWQPTTNDVTDLINEYYHPDKQRDKQFKKIFDND